MSRRRVLGGGRERRAASVEMAPLIDMVFILLIFFMVSTTFVRESGVDISRPSSAFAESVDDGFLPVTVHERGTLHVAGRDVPPDSVRAISTALRDAGRNRVLVQADEKVPTGLLLKVLDTCRLAGATQVDVAATEEQP